MSTRPRRWSSTASGSRSSRTRRCARSSPPRRSGRSRSRATRRCGGRSSRSGAATRWCRRISSRACSERSRATSSRDSCSEQLSRRPAQVHHDGRAGEGAAARTEEEGRRLGDVVRLEQPLHGLRRQQDVLDHALGRDAGGTGLRLDLRLHDRRSDVTGADRRRRNPMLGSLQREHFDEPNEPVLRGDVTGLVRRGNKAVHRCDSEEAAVARVAQRLPGVTGEEEGARQQDGKERVPALLRKVLDRGDVLKAGAGDDRVDAAESLHRGSDGGAVAGRGGEIRLERLARAVRVGTQVDREYVVALPLEAPCDRAADAAGGARHQSPAHARTLRQEGWFGGVRTSTGLPSGSACTWAAYVRVSVSRMICPSSSDVSAPTRGRFVGSSEEMGRSSSSSTSLRRRKTLPLLSPFGDGGMKTITESTSSTYLRV